MTAHQLLLVFPSGVSSSKTEEASDLMLLGGQAPMPTRIFPMPAASLALITIIAPEHEIIDGREPESWSE
jgi:hypothetical protein